MIFLLHTKYLKDAIAYLCTYHFNIKNTVNKPYSQHACLCRVLNSRPLMFPNRNNHYFELILNLLWAFRYEVSVDRCIPAKCYLFLWLYLLYTLHHNVCFRCVTCLWGTLMLWYVTHELPLVLGQQFSVCGRAFLSQRSHVRYSTCQIFMIHNRSKITAM